MRVLRRHWQFLNVAALAFALWQAFGWLTLSERPSGGRTLVAAAAIGALCAWWSLAYRAAARGEPGALAGLLVLALGWGFLVNGVCGLTDCPGLPGEPYSQKVAAFGNLLWGGLASLADLVLLRRGPRSPRRFSQGLIAAALVVAALAARGLA